MSIQVKDEYETAFHRLVGNPEADDAQVVRDKVLDRHNEYVLQLRAANRTIDQFKHTLPEVLEVSKSTVISIEISVLRLYEMQRVCSSAEGSEQDH